MADSAQAAAVGAGGRDGLAVATAAAAWRVRDEIGGAGSDGDIPWVWGSHDPNLNPAPASVPAPAGQ